MTQDDTLTQLCDTWELVMAADGARGLQQRIVRFPVQEILGAPETTAMAWLANSLPPGGDMSPLLGARLLALTEEGIAALAPKYRLMVHSAVMSAALERGRLARASESLDLAMAEIYESPGEAYGEFGTTHVLFFLAAGEYALREGPLVDSLSYYMHALALSRHGCPLAVRFRALVGCAMIHAVNAEPRLAQPMLDEASEIGAQLNIMESGAGARHFWAQAMVWDAVGEEEAILASVERIRYLGDKQPWMELVHFFDATRYMYEGQIPDAIGALRRFLSSAGSLGKIPLLRESGTKLLAINYVIAQQPDAALDTLQHERSGSHAVCLYTAQAFAEIVRGNPEVVRNLTEQCISTTNNGGHGTRAYILVLLARAAAFEILRQHGDADDSYSTALGIANAYEVKALFVPLAREYFASIQKRASRPHHSSLRITFVPANLNFEAVRAARALTEKEREVAQLLLSSGTLSQIGRQLFISENTVKTHTRNIYKKFGVNSRTKLVEIEKLWNFKGTLE